MDMAGFFKILLPWAALISLAPYALCIYCSGKGRRLAAALLYPPLFLLIYFTLGGVLWSPFLKMWPGQGVLGALLGPFLLCHFILVALALISRPANADVQPASEENE
jgi:hypothetical protein